MWKKVENGDSVKPESLDTTSSRRWNYVRKNFELIEATDDYPEHWEWMEIKVLKDDWETYKEVMDHSDALDDVYAALTELAEMVVG